MKGGKEGGKDGRRVREGRKVFGRRAEGMRGRRERKAMERKKQGAIGEGPR